MRYHYGLQEMIQEKEVEGENCISQVLIES